MITKNDSTAKEDSKMLFCVLLLALAALLAPSAGAQQNEPNLLKKTLDDLRALRLTNALAFDLESDTDQGQPLDPDKGWLLDREVFGQLSSAGQQAVLLLNGRGRGLAGSSRSRATFGQNLRVNDPRLDKFGVTQSETSIAARGRNIIIGFNDLDGDFAHGDGYAFSTDNGKTFTQGRIPPVPGGLNLGDPAVVFGPAGEVYYSGIGADAAFRDFIGVSKSLDGGATFAPPVNASTTAVNATDFQDKPWTTVDTRRGSPFLGNVYVSWTDFTRNFGEFIAFARSTDGGQSFSAPVRLTPPTGLGGQGSMPAVAPNGDVYVAFFDFSVGGISVVKSTDGGQSFGSPVTAAQFA